VLPPEDLLPGSDGDDERLGQLRSYRRVFGDRAYLAAELSLGPDDIRQLGRLEDLSRLAGLPLVAANDVLYHTPQRRFLHDVLRCIGLGCTIEQAGRRLTANAERYLKSRDDMARLFADCPQAVARTVEVADRCSFSLDELRYEYPAGLCPPGKRPMQYLAELTWAGARRRYQAGVPKKVRQQIEHELRLIGQLKYEAYFLTVWDVVRFARSRGILCQGRGSAANSAVCFCLGITAVDPDRIEVLFERFISRERNEPPDIDVDFEHQRREEVFEYIYDKYGRDHAAIVAEVITYRSRLAVREVGKVLGLSLDKVDLIAKAVDGGGEDATLAKRLREVGLDPNQRTLQCLVRLVRQIVRFPRHLSQHVGGFVISRGPLGELVPVANAAMPGRTFIEWDKDDIDALGILKVDCLALGMLSALHRCFDFLGRHHGVRMGLADVPPEDYAVYEMIGRADTVGVFQIESRAQMSMLPRLRPKCFYDLVIEVAIVRPGPIVGNMVHPYLRRRKGLDPVRYPNQAIKAVLGKTLGCSRSR